LQFGTASPSAPQSTTTAFMTSCDAGGRGGFRGHRHMDRIGDFARSTSDQTIGFNRRRSCSVSMR
jgi:hypothetical protein